MTGRILIVDTVPTNRIVMKVKMLAAQFAVDACGSRQEAEAIIARNRPDLILINLSDQVEDRHGFCRDLKAAPDTASIAIISIGVADTARARFAALDAGADDVLPRPIEDALLLARIRSLLRVRHARQELMLRDSTSRALGFDEARTNFTHEGRIAWVSDAVGPRHKVAETLKAAVALPVQHFRLDCILSKTSVSPAPDLFVIDGTRITDQGRGLFRLVSDLRCRAETRVAALLVVLPDDNPEIAALLLDLGADDAVASSISPEELGLRAKSLMRQKLLHDALRSTVRNGLTAAVTDSLTGLYNRRYVEPYLAQIAEQARNSQHEFAVMMLDIDHFKLINDTYGHDTGDMVLVEIAQRLRENLRAIDLVARVGGEEFLIAMPRTESGQAHAAADRIRKLISGQPFQIGPKHAPLKVTASVGVATGGLTPLDKSQIATMCSWADAALYAAKSAGRNTVAMSPHNAAA